MRWPGAIRAEARSGRRLQGRVDDGIIVPIDSEAAARPVNGATPHAALWIANARDPQATSQKAGEAFRALLDGLLADRATA